MWKETYRLETMYDYNYVLQRLAMDPLVKLDVESNEIYVPVELENDKHVVKVKFFGSIKKPTVEISSNSLEVKDKLLFIITDIFQWDVGLDQVNNHFSTTNLAQLFKNYPGTPIVKDFHLYGSLMKTIIHQQLNMRFAYRLSTRFVEKYGTREQGVWFYPNPSVVADVSYDELRQLQFSQRKAEYVIDTSRKIVNNELDLKDLSKAVDQTIVQTLTSIRGIGNWTAQSWLLFGLGRQDLFPLTDIGVQNALKKLFQLERKPSIQEMIEWSGEWSPFRSYATMTLWRSIE
ncbi:DNA-3-methyladenine glycosylase family protein [Aquibacillus albus]|uniref:DNA-3-methyladenine glycosylase II n=1 Tax=Aquibacillus albus TaxID=1168171 RepID=A0ABS2N2V8_9BACI|nr:DNA-3-methyladenine glycosylase [Aquibacillus albus]MBM7572431.1 DNA-3-methyladenine glycosylase II [Aquibacillus albus]